MSPSSPGRMARGAGSFSLLGWGCHGCSVGTCPCVVPVCTKQPKQAAHGMNWEEVIDYLNQGRDANAWRLLRTSLGQHPTLDPETTWRLIEVFDSVFDASPDEPTTASSASFADMDTTRHALLQCLRDGFADLAQVEAGASESSEELVRELHTIPRARQTASPKRLQQPIFAFIAVSTWGLGGPCVFPVPTHQRASKAAFTDAHGSRHLCDISRASRGFKTPF